LQHFCGTTCGHMSIAYRSVLARLQYGCSKWLFSNIHPVRAEPVYDEYYNAVPKL
jgi:hypothetical protein